MSTFGLAFSDESFLAAHSESSKRHLIALENEAMGSPGFVYYDGVRYICGRQAENRCRVYPRYVSDCCWGQLSLRVSELTVPGRIPLYSELAYHHLRHVWRRLNTERAVEKIVLALPGDYLMGKYGNEEKVGLVLGMVRDLKMPLAGIVDMACASAAAQAHTLDARGGPALHLDIHQHATLISLLRLGPTIRREHLVRSSIGWAKVLGELIPKLANRFLSQTAFDMTHSAESEQQFYSQTKQLIEILKEAEEGTIEMGGVKRSRKMSVYRDTVTRDLQTINEATVQLIDKTLVEAGGDKDSWPLLLSESAARIPGLVEKLTQWGKGHLFFMPLGAAAYGAALFATGKAVFKNLEEVPLTTSITLQKHGLSLGKTTSITPQETAKPQPVARDSLANPADRAISEASRLDNVSPTHLVFDGIAHPIDLKGFYIGRSIPEGINGLCLPSSYKAIAEEYCRLHVAEGRLLLENHGGGSILLNHRPAQSQEYLKIGDLISFGNSPYRVDLLLVYCPT